MRHAIHTKLSFLTYRIQRRPPGMSSQVDSSSDADAEWEWPEAEDRLDRALEKGGPYAWIEAAMKEVEHEARNERITKGIDSNDTTNV